MERGQKVRRDRMSVSGQIAQRFRDRVRLELAAGRFLSREQEKALYLEAIASGIALEDARGLRVGGGGTPGKA